MSPAWRSDLSTLLSAPLASEANDLDSEINNQQQILSLNLTKFSQLVNRIRQPF